LHGFLSAEDYYEKSSSRPYLSNIQVATLLLHSQDDPFMTRDVIPALTELPSKVRLEVTQSGGHVGFISGRVPWRARYWLEHRVPEFLNDVFCHSEQMSS